jgi:hypothetical protein
LSLTSHASHVIMCLQFPNNKPSRSYAAYYDSQLLILQSYLS